MTVEAMNEQALVEKFAQAKEKLDSLKEQCSLAQKEFDTVEANLVELLQTEEKEATARYERIGYCSLSKPRIYANCKEENRTDLFKYLRAHKRGDLIKPTVNPQSLSTYVGELLASAKQVPDFIGYYLKTGVRYYKGD
jgi:septal ring factor EnvC (AmiA/AmiB activator)